MFYQTRVKNVTAGGIIDTNGKFLSFIGDKFVNEGDIVWTDGKIVFGHTTIRGKPLLIDEPSGIPVLGDYDSEGNELRGYFTNRGKYKTYRVKGDEWITNGEKTFAHDGTFEGIDDEHIIDAEVALDDDDNEVGFLTVEKKVTQLVDDDDDSKMFFYHYYSTNWQTYYWQDYYSMLNFERDTRGWDAAQDYYQQWWILNPRNNPDYLKNTTPIIKQAEWTSTVFTDHEFIDRDGDGIFRDCELIIWQDGKELETLKLSKLVEVAETAALEYVNVTVPSYAPKDYIKSAANLLNFKINPDGKWTLLFEIEIGAERDYPRPEDNGYDDLHKWREWLAYSTAAVHSYFIFKVDSDDNSEKIAERSSFMPLYLIDNIKIQAVAIPFSAGDEVNPPFVAIKNSFPYNDCTWAGFDENLGTGEGVTYWTTFDVWDSRLIPNAPDYDNDLEEFADFDFPVQDDYQAKITHCDAESDEDIDIDKWQFGGISDADNKPVIGAILPDETDAHKWNMSCASLKGGAYLFGIRKDDDREIDGALYKIDDKGTVEQVGDGLKNFRLRELKRISKAKK